ncbi:MAG: hypothetical protein IJW43_00495 [Clostridia bacterium]|nr:hypothetical protein [Clostridia bacterium]
MSLQVSLKLKLSKQIKKIKVKYNTFEKATYDEYLICSLALRTANDKNQEKTVFDYIDDVTGEGSLNKHFRNIYARVKTFSAEQLSMIMANSMIPTLKIDEKNRYEYYPQLNVSVYNKKIYQGDLGTYNNLPQIIMINEEIIDMSIETVKDDTKPEQYSVTFDEKENIKVRLLNDYLPIDNEIFEESLCLDLGNINSYQGKIHDNVDGNGWRVLNNSALSNLFSNRNYYYDNGDHFFIRNDSVRKTIISKVHGLYIYKEDILSYQGNAILCDKVIDFLLENKTIGEFKPKSILFMLKYVSNKKAQKVVNSLLLKKEEKEIALYGLDLMERGLVNGWLVTVTKTFLKYASGYQLNLIYQANAELNYTIEQLIQIDADLLQFEHKMQVKKYNEDLEAKRKTIREITGDITTKGLREKAKALESDEITKKFSKLCNRLIGHVNEGLDDVSLTTLEQWHKDALELKEISILIQRKLENN